MAYYKNLLFVRLTSNEAQSLGFLGLALLLKVMISLLSASSSPPNLVIVAVIVLRFTKPDYERRFMIPLNIGRFPLLLTISVALIVFFIVISFTDWIIWVSTAVVVFIGLMFYKKQ